MIIFSKACRLALWPTPPLIQLEEEGREEEGREEEGREGGGGRR